MATVCLIDFKSSEENTQTKNLFQLLKQKINKPLSIPFSLKFDKVSTLSTPGLCYDLTISYSHDKIIASSEHFILVFNCLKKGEYGGNEQTIIQELDSSHSLEAFHCLHLSSCESNDGQDYIYATTSSKVVKLNGIVNMIWVSEEDFGFTSLQ